VNRRTLLAASLALAVLAVARADDPPLSKAKVGEWTLQKQVISGSMTLGVYMYVSKVEGKKVTIVTQPLAADMKTPSAAAQTHNPIDLEKYQANKDEKKLADEDVEVKGKKIKCRKTESTTDTSSGKVTTTTWSSSDIPVYGIVRQIVKDKDGKELLHSDLVDWGADGAKEKPVPVEKTDKDTKKPDEKK
jgi:hypothetical protein